MGKPIHVWAMVSLNVSIFWNKFQLFGKTLIKCGNFFPFTFLYFQILVVPLYKNEIFFSLVTLDKNSKLMKLAAHLVAHMRKKYNKKDLSFQLSKGNCFIWVSSTGVTLSRKEQDASKSSKVSSPKSQDII